MTTRLEADLKRVEAWACCGEPSSRVRAEHRIRQLEAALKPFADAFKAAGIQWYRDADADKVAIVDCYTLAPGHGITMQQYRHAWETITGNKATEKE